MVSQCGSLRPESLEIDLIENLIISIKQTWVLSLLCRTLDTRKKFNVTSRLVSYIVLQSVLIIIQFSFSWSCIVDLTLSVNRMFTKFSSRYE